MTVLLTKPFDGKGIGEFYTGPQEETLISNQMAVNESGGTFWTIGTTTHTLGARDANRELQFNSATAVTVRVPNEIEKLPFGIIATYRQTGAGQVSLVADTGVTITATTGFAKTSAAGAVIQVAKTGNKTVAVFGALSTS